MLCYVWNVQTIDTSLLQCLCVQCNGVSLFIWLLPKLFLKLLILRIQLRKLVFVAVQNGLVITIWTGAHGLCTAAQLASRVQLSWGMSGERTVTCERGNVNWESAHGWFEVIFYVGNLSSVTALASENCPGLEISGENLQGEKCPDLSEGLQASTWLTTTAIHQLYYYLSQLR